MGKTQFQLNQEIIQFIKNKDSKKESYSSKDIEFILQYSGAGGKIKEGAKSTAKGGNNPLYEFYTPKYIADAMFQLAQKYGYDGGHVLDCACGTGRLIDPIPDKSKVVAFELTKLTARIAQICYPEATIYNQYFETAFMQAPLYRSRLQQNATWLQQYPFSLIIGNPPYGKYKSLYSSYFKKPKIMQVEHFFIYYGLKLLKKDGLLVYIIPQSFIRNGHSYNSIKDEIEKIAVLIDAYRLPPVFDNSQIPTDIIVLKKK